MGTEYSRGFCQQCDDNTKMQCKTPNHILHLLITIVLGIFTYGVGAIAWILVWLTLSVKSGKFICSTCGKSFETTKK